MFNKCAKVICESNQNIEQLWELESVGITKEVMSPSEVVTVGLPFKTTERSSVNFRITKGQLDNVQRKIKSSPTF